LFFIFFGLPSLGLKITEWQAAALAMVINLGAYSTEIIRAGIQAIPRGQLEAAAALAMTRFEAFRHEVLLPALGWGEKEGTVTNSERRISRQRAFLPAPGEAMADWEILALFAQRIG
ncbi:molybdopterin-dependent oxidoreductase, partial [Pseudomonas viridiflava]|uniref:molybdopterin-dependent oxidoreductase n=1 Tax=Pseudomonas viridiflava TaxID=33069 RepID=UPI000F05629B